jgi:hypothetical protein
LAIPEAHVEEVLIDTLHETVIVTAALHSVQHIVHPAKTTTKLKTSVSPVSTFHTTE